ncbi:Gfo/Idh/MocA family protein [Paenibacillus mucilaginosus]|uniref:Oxidoreductase domain protein n=1 Tax=Paenibacillus mucilaginosus (strain KNP414) TaxID=1036673 RepID=F8F4T2_PAEMK|nr:Gfo/Idh/MocA family oxidoreductase [Paenibacillus mucilaginosus]AEI40662.1 oxidoreductase domain protein [Paenibacillus mucilaginosus KNP414]MCG7211852.1 Gfo/Idh/MocA family oxidoreductase [Paenibacillus mucilaginosus]WDM29799.1 Gfo/Idh/MocA family oxidoreductase [Paenibacillus mucilaginosus]
MSRPAVFGIIGGGGFRAQYFLRIAQALPDEFRVGGMVVRDESKGREMEQQWRVPTYRTLEQLLESESLDFVVVSVSASAGYEYLLQLAERGIPALAETPPAPDLEGLHLLHEKLTCRGARVQVAEQYPLHPMNQARLAVIAEGRLGKVTEATVSISHFYHGIGLLRKMLGIRFEDAHIRAMRFQSEWVAGPSRSGPPTEEQIIPSQRDLAWLNFGGKLGIYDFTKDQHRSWIRSNHLSVRGVRGEIFDDRLTVLEDFRTPLHLNFKRVNKGELENQEGYFLKGILAGERWVYENPFAPARLYDDEIAIAGCLRKMAAYASGGPSFYSLPEASQDCYLGMLLEQAIHTGTDVVSERQPWAMEETR